MRIPQSALPSAGLFRLSGLVQPGISTPTRTVLRGLATALATLLPLACLAQDTPGWAPSAGLAVSGVPRSAALAADYGKLPLSFEANQGQTDPQVRFLSRGSGYSLFLTDKAAVLSLTKPAKGALQIPGAVKPGAKPMQSSPGQAQTDVVRMELAGSAPGARVTGAEQLPGKANYFIGNNPAKWHANVPTYAEVKYTGVYPGVDVVYYGNQRQLEYDFVVAPGADPRQVRLHFAGAERLKLEPNGDLQVIAENGTVAFNKPFIYQEARGLRQPIQGGFVLRSNNTAGFALGRYDHTRSLVIDPVLAYSTYLGGSKGAYGSGIAVDSVGDAYVTGGTNDMDFPVTAGSYQLRNNAGTGVSNVFVTKLNSTGTSLVYSTYLGGSGNSDGKGDAGLAIAVDSSGNSYVTGYAYSSNFPMKSPFQSINHAAASLLCDPFVAKINSAGNALVYSTYLGGSSNINGFLQGDLGLGIIVNSAGNAYIVGTTYSLDFPITSAAFQKSNYAAISNNSNDGFITEISASGETLVYSTFLGGSAAATSSPCCEVTGDGIRGVAVDSSGNAFVTGLAGSTDFPVTSGAFQSINNGAANEASNAFVSKLNSTGSGLIYSTYLGGSSATPNLDCYFCEFGDGASSIAIDGAGNAYITGGTYSPDFPITSDAFQKENYAAAHRALTAFATKLNATGTGLIYSTYVGGSGSLGDVAYGIALDPAGDLYISGFTSSDDFPVTTSALQSKNNAAAHGATNAFLTELNPAGTGLLYSSYLGGSALPISDGHTPVGYIGDYDYSMALDSTGDAYLVGAAASLNFPVTSNAFQKSNNAAPAGSANVFVTKVNLAGATTTKVPTTTTLTASRYDSTYPQPVTFTATVKAASEPTPEGNVTFKSGETWIGEAAVVEGAASLTTTALPVGTLSITAIYEGDSAHAGSTSPVLKEVVK